MRDPDFVKRGLAILGAVLLSFGAAAWWVVADKRAQTACGFDPPELSERFRTAGRDADWDWWPPGHVCIYERNGREVGRRRL